MTLFESDFEKGGEVSLVTHSVNGKPFTPFAGGAATGPLSARQYASAKRDADLRGQQFAYAEGVPISPTQYRR